jgi:hypothetical protein
MHEIIDKYLKISSRIKQGFKLIKLINLILILIKLLFHMIIEIVKINM